MEGEAGQVVWEGGSLLSKLFGAWCSGMPSEFQEEAWEAAAYGVNSGTWENLGGGKSDCMAAGR